MDIRIMSKTRKFFVAVAILLLIAFTYWCKGFLEIDKCLDSGGRWNYEVGTCEYQE